MLITSDIVEHRNFHYVIVDPPPCVTWLSQSVSRLCYLQPSWRMTRHASPCITAFICLVTLTLNDLSFLSTTGDMIFKNGSSNYSFSTTLIAVTNSTEIKSAVVAFPISSVRFSMLPRFCVFYFSLIFEVRFY